MFVTDYSHQSLGLVEEVFSGLSFKKNMISTLQQKSGIDTLAVNRFLNDIKMHHIGTYLHSLNVARLSAQLACQLKLSALDVYIISIGALLHDVGKTIISCNILDKKGRLNNDEWSLVKKHPQQGADIILRYDWGEQLKPMLLLHHERLDGKGYFCVSAEKIPLAARIVILTDAYDAMVSPRPYQRKRDILSCWEEIDSCSGTQFDSELIPSFYSVIMHNRKLS